MSEKNIEIKKMWRIIGTSNSSILELRAIWPSGLQPAKPPLTIHFKAIEFGGIEVCKSAFENEAFRLNTIGYNIYMVMNPIKSTFKGGAVKDEDISFRDLLLIDIDRIEKIKAPATEAEVEEAKKIADEVIVYLASMEWPQPIRVMSGNGHHLYYVLNELSNDDESKKYVQHLLKSLAKEFDNKAAKIDTTVFNASRVTKVVGTFARKGLESADRPYRMAVVI